MGTPDKTVLYGNPAPVGATSPLYTNGWLIQFRQHPSKGSGADIYLYTKDGKLAFADTFWPAGTTELLLTSMDISEGGTVALAGERVLTGGATARFLAWCSLDGANCQIHETQDYLPTQICIAPDKSVWTVGGVYPTINGSSKRWDNYRVLRHYSVDGTLLDEDLPRWPKQVSYVVEESTPSSGNRIKAFDNQGKEISDWMSDRGFKNALGSQERAKIRIVDNGVLIYNGRSGEIVRKDTQTGLLKRWHLNSSVDDMSISGIAILPNSLIISSRGSKSQSTAKAGIYALELFNNGTAEWKPLIENHTSLPIYPVAAQILGSENGSAVYRISSAPTGTVYWSSVAAWTVATK
jgi:hypothetical protein